MNRTVKIRIPRTKDAKRCLLTTAVIGLLTLLPPMTHARDIGYEGQEVAVFVSPNEPTQVNFPGDIAGGYMKTDATVQLERQGADLILFAKPSLESEGEAIIVRLKDGRSFSIRVRPANDSNPRDSHVKVEDLSSPLFDSEEGDSPIHESKEYDKAPSNVLSGFMRELVLQAEFTKPQIRGYRVNEQYRGQTVFNDGTLNATIDKIFIGPRYWGYVLDAENLVDTAQRINPGTFRLDGTRAISCSKWDLSPKPLTMEQKIAGQHKTKIYIITKAKK
jgi:hypothetical protein